MPESNANKREAENAAAAPVESKTGPGKWLVLLAGIAILGEIAFITLLFSRQNDAKDMKEQIGRLNLARTRADEIRVAWDELAEEGASFRARIGKAEGDPADIKAYIQDCAKTNKLEISIKGPTEFDAGKGVEASRFVISGNGPGQGILNFLIDLGKAPALVNIQKFGISGAANSRANINMTLYQYRLKPRSLDSMKEFVSSLPAAPPQVKPRTDFSRRKALFVPRLASRENALRGWPRIMLGGFSENKALMIVDGTPKTISVGEAAAAGIIYTEKFSVNQAILKRQRDGSEILITVGSPEYALKPSEIREMSGFTLMLQKRQQASLLRELSGP